MTHPIKWMPAEDLDPGSFDAEFPLGTLYVGPGEDGRIDWGVQFDHLVEGSSMEARQATVEAEACARQTIAEALAAMSAHVTPRQRALERARGIVEAHAKVGTDYPDRLMATMIADAIGDHDPRAVDHLLKCCVRFCTATESADAESGYVDIMNALRSMGELVEVDGRLVAKPKAGA